MLSASRRDEFTGPCTDALSRQELLEALRFRKHCLPPDLREGLERQPMDRLLLLFLAARLLGALRYCGK